MQESQPNSKRRNIVAIGASAGGLGALTIVLSEFPASLPAAVLVVMHLERHHASLLADLLGRKTSMKVVQAGDGDAIEESTIYVAPPDRHVVIAGERIHLSATGLVHFVRPSVDVLFESVAGVYGDRAVGVILTGSGTDGADGICAIKAKGGFTIAQDPATAQSTGMPEAAINTGCIDTVLPLEEIGAAVIKAVSMENQGSRYKC